MTKRIVGVAFAAAAAAAFVLPTAPAHASCISIITTPEDCVRQAVSQLVAAPDCVRYGTYDLVCLPPAG